MATKDTLLSLCIPTYNRADCLDRLLNAVVPQVSPYGEQVEICIANNGSTDNTRQIVSDFQSKHPGLIKYHENETNLGFDRNVIAAVSMADGEFVWTFSDDDLIVEDGFGKVMEVIKRNRHKDMGGLVVKFSSYTSDDETGEQVLYQTSNVGSKPRTYGGLSCVEMIRDGNSYAGLPELVFNNTYLRRMLTREEHLVRNGIGTHHMHMWLFFLLFLRNPGAKFHVLNEVIVVSPDTVSKTRFAMDDHVELLFRSRIEFYDKLLEVVDKSEKDIIRAIKKHLIRRPVLSMIYIIGLYVAFGEATYRSCGQSMRLSFKYLSPVKALVVSASLVTLLIIPTRLVKQLWKFSLRLRARTKADADQIWLGTTIAFRSWCRGTGPIRAEWKLLGSVQAEEPMTTLQDKARPFETESLLGTDVDKGASSNE